MSEDGFISDHETWPTPKWRSSRAPCLRLADFVLRKFDLFCVAKKMTRRARLIRSKLNFNIRFHSYSRMRARGRPHSTTDGTKRKKHTRSRAATEDKEQTCWHDKPKRIHATNETVAVTDTTACNLLKIWQVHQNILVRLSSLYRQGPRIVELVTHIKDKEHTRSRRN